MASARTGRERTRKRARVSRSGGPAVARAAVLGFLLLLGASILWWRQRDAGEGTLASLPAPTYVTEAGRPLARIDAAALAAWCERQGLPEPPPISEAEPAVIDAILSALRGVVSEGTAEAFGQMGRVAESLEAHQSAEDYFRLAAAEAPGDHRWPYHLGCIHQVVGRNAEAEAAFERVLALEPGYPVTYARLGQLHLEAGRLDRAEETFRRYRELRPADWLGPVGLARVELGRGRAAEALRLLEQAAAIRSDDFQVQFYLGQAYAALGRREEAQTAFARAEALPQGSWFHLRDPLDQAVEASVRSVATLESEFEQAAASGDLATLTNVAEELLRRRPDDLAMTANLAGIYRKLGRLDDAHAVLDRGLERHPGSARLLNARAEVFLGARDLTRGLAAADEAIASDPSYAPGWASRGRALIVLQRDEEAVASLAEHLRLLPALPAGPRAAAQFLLGEAHRLGGRPAMAEVAYEEAFRLDPGLASARERLGQLREGR